VEEEWVRGVMRWVLGRRRGSRDATARRGDTDGIDIDREVARDSDIDRGAETDTDIGIVVRIDIAIDLDTRIVMSYEKEFEVQIRGTEDTGPEAQTDDVRKEKIVGQDGMYEMMMIEDVEEADHLHIENARIDGKGRGIFKRGIFSDGVWCL